MGLWEDAQQNKSAEEAAAQEERANIQSWVHRQEKEIREFIDAMTRLNIAPARNQLYYYYRSWDAHHADSGPGSTGYSKVAGAFISGWVIGKVSKSSFGRHAEFDIVVDTNGLLYNMQNPEPVIVSRTFRRDRIDYHPKPMKLPVFDFRDESDQRDYYRQPNWETLSDALREAIEKNM